VDEDTADLLTKLCEELDYYIGSDEPGTCLDSTDAEDLITEARQKVYDNDVKKFDIVGEPEPRVIKVRL